MQRNHQRLQQMQERNYEGYDYCCDLWSLGVVIYVMLCGRYPFDGQNMTTNMYRANYQFPSRKREFEFQGFGFLRGWDLYCELLF